MLAGDRRRSVEGRLASFSQIFCNGSFFNFFFLSQLVRRSCKMTKAVAPEEAIEEEIVVVPRSRESNRHFLANQFVKTKKPWPLFLVHPPIILCFRAQCEHHQVHAHQLHPEEPL
jgi:hypothetical protein